jgi:hypothetical protein
MKSARILQILIIAIKSPRLVFLIALVARFRVLSDLLPAHAWRDFYQYNEFARIAWAMVTGHGYSSPWANTPLAATAVEPPMYTYIVAAIFKLAGAYSYASLWIGVGLNAVLSAFTAVLILLIGKRDFSPATGVLAAWVWSGWIYEAAVSIRLWESSLAAVLLMIAFWWHPELAQRKSAGRWLAFGGLAGVAALTNTTLLSVFPCLWAWLWLGYRRQGRSCSNVLLASVAVFILTLIPWTIRNYATFGRLMPIRDNFGLELWIGNHEGATESHQYPNDFPILDPTEYNRLGELPFMEARRHMAAQFILQHPLDFLSLSAWRFFGFWITPAGTVWPLLSFLSWVGLALILKRRRWQAVPYAMVVVVFPLIYYVTHSFPTYRHPIEPVLILLAMHAVVSGADALFARLRLSLRRPIAANHFV